MDYANRIKIFDAIIKSNMGKDKNNEILLKHLKKENVILFKILEESNISKVHKLSKDIIQNKIPSASDFIDHAETFVNDPTIATGYDLAKTSLKTVQPFLSQDISERVNAGLHAIGQTEKFVDASQSINQEPENFIVDPDNFVTNKLD